LARFASVGSECRVVEPHRVNRVRHAPIVAAVLVLGMGLLATGCAVTPLLERAVRARGGPLRSFVRVADAEVEAGFPGTWQLRMVYLGPDRYAWSIVTAAGVDHYVFDGIAVRAIVAGRTVAVDTAPSAPLRVQAAFVAVTNLDAARNAGSVTPLPASELPPGVVSGVSVVMPPDGVFYRLGFDDRMLLVWATGPFEVPQLGRVELSVRYDDHRLVGGLWMPFRAVYDLASRRIAVERTLHLCPNEPALGAEAFEDPDRLPACAGP
jgi:hypothetical protein